MEFHINLHKSKLEILMEILEVFIKNKSKGSL